jgi:hypothetical protein
MAKKKILLINPSFPESLWGFTRIQSVVGIHYGFLPLALPTLAALTPEQFDITLIDECVEPIDFDTPCDVVALTAFNVQSQRAFEILHAFKPTVSLDIISLLASSCGYYRGHIEHCAAH